MKIGASKSFLYNSTATRVKRILLIVLGVVLLFFVCNNVLMPWFVGHGGTVHVPSVVGMPFERAKQMIDSLELEALQGDIRTSENFSAGIVIAQNPISEMTVKKGRRVYLTVSGGEQLVQVPNLKGKTIRDAKFAIDRNGLKIGAITYTVNDSFPVNTIINQSVAPFSKVKRALHISVVVSQGISVDRLAVPDVVGKTLSEAGKILADHSLRIGTVTYQSSPTLLPNTIVDQYPRSGELVEHGQSIDLFVVRGGERKKPSTEN